MRILALLLSLGACLAGCRPQPAPAPRPEGHWAPSHATHVQVGVQSLGEIANNGLFLPAASPDAAQVAWLRVNGMEQALGPDALAGPGAIERVSLHVRAANPQASGRTVADGRVAWPVWSADGKLLAFIAYGREAPCSLGLFDTTTGATRYLPLPGDRAMMPAVSPSGRQVALCVAAAGSEAFGLRVIDLTGGPGAAWPEEARASQYWPQWIADGQLVCLHAGAKGMQLAAWTPGTPPRAIAGVGIAGAPLAAYMALAGVGRPLSPEGRRFAYYQQANDRIVLVNLADGKETPLDPKTRAGCWLGEGRFAAATDSAVTLVDMEGRSATLLRGPWLPRAGAGGRLVACTAGRLQATFGLAVVTVTVEGM